MVVVLIRAAVFPPLLTSSRRARTRTADPWSPRLVPISSSRAEFDLECFRRRTVGKSTNGWRAALLEEQAAPEPPTGDHSKPSHRLRRAAFAGLHRARGGGPSRRGLPPRDRRHRPALREPDRLRDAAGVGAPNRQGAGGVKGGRAWLRDADVASTITQLASPTWMGRQSSSARRTGSRPRRRSRRCSIPRGSWLLDAIHAQILPLHGYAPTTNHTRAELMRRARFGVERTSAIARCDAGASYVALRPEFRACQGQLSAAGVARREERRREASA